MSVPNQKIVQLARRTARDKNHLYAPMNIDALQAAMQVLNGSGLKLWLYLNKNQDNYRTELSRVDCAKWGIKKDSYYSAVDELIKKGFLVQDHYGSNVFWFHEKAVSVKPNHFSENQTEESEKPKKVSENTERNITDITDNTEIIQNTTLDNDIAKGDIVDCGDAANHNESDFDSKMKEWFGTYKHEQVCESPTALLDKYFY